MIGKGDDPGARGAVAGDLEKIKKNERNGMPPLIKGCYIDVTERRWRQATGNGNAATPGSHRNGKKARTRNISPG